MDALIPNGQTAPTFSLPALDGSVHSLEEQRGRLAILNFWSAECPWAERADALLLDYLAEWGNKVVLWPIACNANEPIELLARVVKQRGLPLALHDAQQQVADLYGAQATPHLFVVDSQGILRYQGALDDASFRNRNPSHFYLRQAVEAILADMEPDQALTQPYGCAIMRYQP
jgi:peroxiredoxin